MSALRTRGSSGHVTVIKYRMTIVNHQQRLKYQRIFHPSVTYFSYPGSLNGCIYLFMAVFCLFCVFSDLLHVLGHLTHASPSSIQTEWDLFFFYLFQGLSMRFNQPAYPSVGIGSSSYFPFNVAALASMSNQQLEVSNERCIHTLHATVPQLIWCASPGTRQLAQVCGSAPTAIYGCLHCHCVIESMVCSVRS